MTLFILISKANQIIASDTIINQAMLVHDGCTMARVWAVWPIETPTCVLLQSQLNLLRKLRSFLLNAEAQYTEIGFL